MKKMRFGFKRNLFVWWWPILFWLNMIAGVFLCVFAVLEQRGFIAAMVIFSMIVLLYAKSRYDFINWVFNLRKAFIGTPYENFIKKPISGVFYVFYIETVIVTINGIIVAVLLLR